MNKTLRLILGLGLFLALGISLAAAVHSDEPGSAPAEGAGDKPRNADRRSVPTFEQRRPRYRLAAGDALELDFPYSPEFNQTVTIQPDGYITLKNVGDLYVQGKTTAELAEALRETYGKILHDPVVTVDLKDFQKPYFIAGGEVGHPGKYDLREDTTVAEAVAIAGGFSESAKHSQVLLFRRASPGYVEVKKINVKKMLNSANLREDVYLHPGDMLYVPKSTISKVKRFMPTEALALYFSPSTL